MSRHQDRSNRKHDSRRNTWGHKRPPQQSHQQSKPLTAEERAKLENDRIRARKRREWIARKIAHWERMGTQSEISPITGAAVPKWKLEADRKRAEKLRNECHRHCRRDHIRRAAV